MTLYVMLVGAYPFEDPTDPRNFRKTIQVRRSGKCFGLAPAAAPCRHAGGLLLEDRMLSGLLHKGCRPLSV